MSISWTSLTLTGFGRYKDTVTFSFHPGINVCIAANEQGKSTMAAGVAAVIYGLGATQDPKVFGQERFRNWDGAARFEGELEFKVNQGRYRIQRNFETHRVSLQKFQEGQWAQVVGGEHNPGAIRKPNVAYAGAIKELLGIPGRDLFMATYYVLQPLPEGEKMLPAIGQLLSGAGTHYRDALQVLLTSLRTLTRHTGRLGITPQDMRQDRRLEKLVEESSQLTGRLQHSEGMLQEMREVTDKLRQATEQRKQLTDVLADKKRLLDAWGSWRILRDRYGDALSRQNSLDHAREQAGILQVKMTENEEQLLSQFADVAAMSADTGEELAQLIRSEVALSQLEKDATEAENQLQMALAVLSGAESELEKLSAVRGRATLVADCQKLQQLMAKDIQLQASLLTGREQLEATRVKLDAMPHFDKFGKSPQQVLLTLKRDVGYFLQEWQEFEYTLDLLNAIEKQLAGEFHLFQQSSDEQLASFAAYEANQFRLEKELAQAQAAVTHVKVKVDELEGAKQRFYQQFSDLDSLDSQALALVNEKIAILVQRAGETSALGAAGSSGSLLWWVVLFFTVVAGSFAFFISDSVQTGLLAAILFGISGVIGVSLHGKKSQKGLPPTRQVHRDEELRQIDLALGSFAALGQPELGELRVRLRQRDVEGEKVERLCQDLPDPDLLIALQTERSQAESARATLQAQSSAALARFSDISGAFRRWQDAVKEAASLRRRVEQFTLRYANHIEPTALGKQAAADMQSPWPDLVLLSAVFGSDAYSAQEIISWLNTLDDGWWTAATTEAQEFEWLTEKLRDADHLASLHGQGQAELALEISKLRESVAPFDQDTDLGELEMMYNNSLAAAETRVKQVALVEAGQGNCGQIAEKRAHLLAQAEPLKEKLADLLSTGAAPEELLRRWRQAEEMKRAQTEDRKKLAGITSAHGVPSVEELRRMAIDAANRAVGLYQEWDALNGAHPSLPGTDPPDPALVDATFRGLEKDVAERSAQEDALHQAIRELELRFARLQGQTPLNIAAGVARLRELTQEEERVKREIAALQIAYLELSTAIDQYSLSYREEFAQKTSQYFAQLSTVENRHIQMDEDFSVAVVTNGRATSVSQLSQGARDQLYLALRLASADLLAADVHLPFIFDDPFLNWDQERLSRMRITLTNMETERQVVLLSHRDEFSTWGQQCIKKL